MPTIGPPLGQFSKALYGLISSPLGAGLGILLAYMLKISVLTNPVLYGVIVLVPVGVLTFIAVLTSPANAPPPVAPAAPK